MAQTQQFSRAKAYFQFIRQRKATLDLVYAILNSWARKLT